MITSLISNPPYNMKWQRPPFAQLQPRFNDCEVPPESNANFAFVLTALEKIDDKSVFLLPCIVLSGETKEESAIMQYLVDKNFIEAVITCPDKMFESTSIATCILVLNKNKQTTNVVLIDMRYTFEIEKREQNGQRGGSAHTNRTYVKEVKVFSEEQIKKVIDTISEQKDIDEFSKVVTCQQIAGDKYNLLPSHYFEFIEKENIHRPYEDIIQDLNRTISAKNLCKLTINETMAKSLGLYDFGIMQKQARETAKGMNSNGIGKLLGQKIVEDDYIRLTKNKNEIKFENTSKDEISPVFATIFQLYKSHIIYLNNEENRYLVELRDAILPDLMSGKISVDAIDEEE